MRAISLTHDYDFPARDVWDVAVDYDCLAEVMQSLITFDGLPKGRVEAGQAVTVMVSLFGKLPAQPYHMEVVQFDDAEMELVSSERGAGVTFWRHRMWVTAQGLGCQLHDHIEIEAGWATALFALWARYFYGKRHGPRLRILGCRAALTATHG